MTDTFSHFAAAPFCESNKIIYQADAVSILCGKLF